MRMRIYVHRETSDLDLYVGVQREHGISILTFCSKSGIWSYTSDFYLSNYVINDVDFTIKADIYLFSHNQLGREMPIDIGRRAFHNANRVLQEHVVFNYHYFWQVCAISAARAIESYGPSWYIRCANKIRQDNIAKMFLILITNWLIHIFVYLFGLKLWMQNCFWLSNKLIKKFEFSRMIAI